MNEVFYGDESLYQSGPYDGCHTTAPTESHDHVSSSPSPRYCVLGQEWEIALSYNEKIPSHARKHVSRTISRRGISTTTKNVLVDLR